MSAVPKADWRLYATWGIIMIATISGNEPIERALAHVIAAGIFFGCAVLLSFGRDLRKNGDPGAAQESER